MFLLTSHKCRSAFLFRYGAAASHNSTDGSDFKEAGHVDASLVNGASKSRGPVYIGLFAENNGYADFDCFKYREVIPEISPKLISKNGNPLLDFLFTADPTAVEHDGRLYVYATNDHQQYEGVGRDGKNTYEKIKTLAMMSTDDMVNWTYHGLINVGEIAPWIMASWAPSIIKRQESASFISLSILVMSAPSRIIMLLPAPIDSHPVPSASMTAPGSKGTLHLPSPGVLASTRLLSSGLVQGPTGDVAVSTPVPKPLLEK